MPLGKDAYEKALGRKLTDAEYQKLSGAAASGPMSRAPGAEAGAKIPIGTRDGEIPRTPYTPENLYTLEKNNAAAQEENRKAGMWQAAEDEAREAKAKGLFLPAPAPAPAPESPPVANSGMFVSARLPTKALPVAATGVVPLAAVAGAGVGLKTNAPKDASHTMGDTLPAAPAPPAAPVAGAQVQPESDYAAIISGARKKWGY